MTSPTRDPAEQIEKRDDVQRALKQATGEPEPLNIAPSRADKAWFGSYLLLFLALAAARLVLGMSLVPLQPRYVAFAQRLFTGVMVALVVLAVTRLIEALLVARVRSSVSRYNVRRVLRLVSGLLIGLIVLSIVFVNWTTAVVSLGLISLILSFSLQTPISSFAGWIYILLREPYRVGDRIRIGDATGDVIDVGYLDTTLWEFRGDYLSTDHPSGRLIKFPNATVFNTAVYNYSWPLFPYIWNEIRFHVGYQSDLGFVAQIMKEVAEQEMGERMIERVGVYRQLLSQTPVDELTVQERPVVMFRVSDNTWLEAIVRYLVAPKQAGRTKSALIEKMLVRLNAEPDRVLFPKGSAR